ncbi:MAG: pseudouridine synthase [Desulfotomaculales bacterium]
MRERLQKVLARAGISSRRKCEELIRAGRVRVNGQPVRELGFKVDPARDRIELDGRPVQVEPPVYIMLNKPRGYICTLRDPQGRPRVTDLVYGISQRIYPVGRLDYDTEGLLILTNDGDFAHALTHPRHEITKTYLVRVSGRPRNRDLNKLRRGIMLSDGPTAPARVAVIKKDPETTLLKVSIHEGRKRQIRRMLAAIGHPVIELKRIAVGPLTLGELRVGEFRHLTPEEVEKLKRASQGK